MDTVEKIIDDAAERLAAIGCNSFIVCASDPDSHSILENTGLDVVHSIGVGMTTLDLMRARYAKNGMDTTDEY